MEVVLLRVTEDGRTQALTLRHQRTVIGRQTDCDVRVPTPGISRHHCEILIDDDEVMIRDLGSSNGTWVNQERVESQSLKAGDLVSLGKHVFVIRIDGEPEEVDAEACYEDGMPESSEASEPPRVKQGGSTPAASAGAARASRDPEDSSVFDFDFDLSDEDEDDQPPL
ncbi:MAG: FHA domain-containing protein [Phycisphaerales bacterium]